MSVKTASQRMTRAMRAAIKETISPANQGTRMPREQGTLNQAGEVNRRFGNQLHQHVSAYTGLVDEFGCPGNTVDNWRLQFSRGEGGFEAANGAGSDRMRRNRS